VRDARRAGHSFDVQDGLRHGVSPFD
jgi:hypothetical protein